MRATEKTVQNVELTVASKEKLEEENVAAAVNVQEQLRKSILRKTTLYCSIQKRHEFAN